MLESCTLDRWTEEEQLLLDVAGKNNHGGNLRNKLPSHVT
jgi:hypothetical protein